MSSAEPPERENQSDAVKSCAESVMESNPDMDKSTAFAVCQSMENKGQLQEPPEPENPELSHDGPPPHRFLQADFSNLDAVRKTQEGDDVRYENLVLIGAGEWTDATGHTEMYTERALQKIAEAPEEMVEDNSVNVDHKYQDQLLQVGHFDEGSLEYQNGLLLGDVVIYGDKQAGKDIISDMNRALESDGAHGAGGFSIQIPDGGFTRRFNAERGLYELTEFKLAGGAIVTEGASGPANFDEQFPERAVALSSEGEDAGPVRVLSPGDSTKAAMRQSRGMEPVTDIDALNDYADADILTTEDGDPSHLLADGETVKIDIQGADLADIKDALQGAEEGGEMEVAAVIDEYLASDGSPEDNVDTFLEWVRANTDADIDALEAVAADYLAQSEAESLSETPVSEFMAFVNDDAGEGEEAEEPEGEEGMEGEMSGRVEELERKLGEKDDVIRELAERVESLEDRPDYGEPDVESEGEERVVGEVLSGLARDGDYYGR